MLFEGKKLVFVLGAGASKDFGTSMPVGWELANSIADLLNGEFGGDAPSFNGPISKALELTDHGRTSETNKAADIVRRGLHGADSIDDLLDQWRDRPHVLQVGKLAIAQAILNAERKSNLYEANGRDQFLTSLRSMSDTWAGQLVRNVRRTVPRRQIEEALGGVGFVVFNYDRCLEQFLLGEIQNHTASSLDDAQEILDRIPIVHPYGHLGKISGDGVTLGFGQNDDPHKLLKASKKIRTYTEETRDPVAMEQFGRLIATNRVVFLGFSFHPKNMQLIEDRMGVFTQIYSACLNLAPSKQATLFDDWKDFLVDEDKPQIFDLSCSAFMSKYRDAIFDENYPIYGY